MSWKGRRNALWMALAGGIVGWIVSCSADSGNNGPATGSLGMKV